MGHIMWADSGKYKVVGAVFEAARRRAGVTQKDWAARVRKPQSFISNLERGQRRIDVVEFCALAASLGADPRRLFAQMVKGLSKKGT
jgi:transcriptional regulator with XRE-family HTH domain